MKIGILGGGQLGKMLYAPASKLNLDIHFMDIMEDGPVAKVAKNYKVGDITNYEDVLNFGRDKDVMSIEIEKVNTNALKSLQHEGIPSFPQPHIVECIQDKGLQKQFYQQHDLPSSRFKIYRDKTELIADIDSGMWQYPFVLKMRKEGYDGRGVQVIRTATDLDQSFAADFIAEEMVEIDKEIGIVICRNKSGHMVLYDPSEMVFHPEANILLYQLAPAELSNNTLKKIKDLATATASAYDIVGLLAIEMFLTKSGEILINEVAPRPHNSGHHTIESTMCSQYENLLRAICGYPLGATDTLSPSLLMNILGEQGYTGNVHYEGIEKILSLKGVNVHLYGKAITKPYRKMGHINIVGSNKEELIEKYDYINRTLHVIAK